MATCPRGTLVPPTLLTIPPHTPSHFQVWSLVVDVHVLDASGNLPDACCLSALGALMAFRKPEVTVGGASGSEVIIHPPEVKEPLPLTIHHLPVAISFGLFEASRGKGNALGRGGLLLRAPWGLPCGSGRFDPLAVCCFPAP